MREPPLRLRKVPLPGRPVVFPERGRRLLVEHAIRAQQDRLPRRHQAFAGLQKAPRLLFLGGAR